MRKTFDFSGMSDDDLEKKISTRNLWLEAAYNEAAIRTEKHNMECALRFKALHLQHRAMHIEASLIANKVKGTSLPRSGER